MVKFYHEILFKKNKKLLGKHVELLSVLLVFLNRAVKQVCHN